MSRADELEKADGIMRRLAARPVVWELDDGIAVGDNTDPTHPEFPTEFCVSTQEDDGLEEFVPAADLPAAIEKVRAKRRAREEERRG